MFNKLRRYINQNRRKLLIIIGIIVVVILLIRVANDLVAQDSERVNNSGNEIISQEGKTSPNVLHTESIISGDRLSEETATENQELIRNFIDACNDGNVDLAYSYLSSNKKKKMFSTVDEFRTKYYNPIFQTKKQYNIENWISSVEAYTYRVYYVDDILSSGTVTDNIEDYITVVDENNEKKLNIFGYIFNEEINITEENDVAQIEVIDKDTYDDYEIYNIRATNKSENTIMLNRYEDNDKIYVSYQGMSSKYGAFITEIYEQNLILQGGQTKYLSIKINKIYNGLTNPNKLVFSDIINNKEIFDQVSDKTGYSDISTLEINI